MKDKLIVLGILFVTFVVFFFAVTALTDSIARANGFYAVGIQDDKDMMNEYR